MANENVEIKKAINAAVFSLEIEGESIDAAAKEKIEQCLNGQISEMQFFEEVRKLAGQ